MNGSIADFDVLKRRQVISRFTALWALNEAALGGLLHILHIPLTGIFVGGTSVIILTFLARLEVSKVELLKALILVLIIKAGVSPHSPIMAYAAVAFQAFLMFFIFNLPLHFKIKVFLFAFIALLQSGLQKLVILIVVFGLDIVSAIDSFVLFVFNQIGLDISDNFSFVILIITIYLGLHVFSGMFLGFWLEKFTQKIFIGLKNYTPPEIKKINITKKKKISKKKNSLIYSIIILLFLIGLSSFFIEAFNNNLYYRVVIILIRATSILLVWVYIVSPFLKNKVNNFLQKRKSKYRTELNDLNSNISYLQQLIVFLWRDNKNINLFKRINIVIEKVFMAVLADPFKEKIYS